jgi:hypothetical protein
MEQVRTRAREPQWHKKLRAKRSQHRLYARLGLACEYLSRHHGSTVPASLRHLIAEVGGRQHSTDLMCGTCGCDNWSSRSHCRWCQSQLVAGASPSAHTNAAATHIPSNQFSNFAVSSVNSLAALRGDVSAVYNKLEELVAKSTTPEVFCASDFVSLEFVNEMLDQHVLTEVAEPGPSGKANSVNTENVVEDPVIQRMREFLSEGSTTLSKICGRFHVKRAVIDAHFDVSREGRGFSVSLRSPVSPTPIPVVSTPRDATITTPAVSTSPDAVPTDATYYISGDGEYGCKICNAAFWLAAYGTDCPACEDDDADSG